MKTCEARSAIYSKIFSALDESYPARKEAAAIMTHYAVQNKVDPSLSAWQIISKSHELSAIKQSQVQDKQVPSSTEPDPSGVPDKKYPKSALGDDYESCIKGITDLGVDSDKAADECSTQWKGKGTVSGKTKRAVLNNIIMKYPNLSRESAKDIVNQVIKEASQNKSIRQASLENQVPYFVVVSDIDTSHLTNTNPTTSTHLRNASIDERKQYFDAISEGTVDTLRNRTVRSDKASKIKSAKLKEKSDSEVPAWAKVTGDL